MKLNLKKCTFGVEGGGVVSGFYVKPQGIEANPNKCRAITDLRSPKNIKEVQHLLGHLTTLSRFVPCLAERSKPMVQLHRKVAKFSLG